MLAMSKVDELHKQVSEIRAQLIVINKTLTGIVNTISIGANHTPPPGLGGESYANALSKNLSDTIKSAIA